MNPVIARRRLFSTAHLYHQPQLTPQANREIFGACYSEFGHGHNYVLEIFVEGPIDPESGLVINVNDLDAIMKTVCEPFDHKHISFEHPVFKTKIPTTEHLTQFFFDEIKQVLAERHPGLKLNRLRLFETDDLWATARADERRLKGFELTREFVIRSIHHLENATWTQVENKAFYGICYGAHGHDYHIQVTCAGGMNDQTGLVLDRDELDAVLEKEIRSKYDGVDLNKRFKNTSCEQLAIEFYQILKPLLPGLRKVGIQETRKNYFEFPPVG